jgi:hypothetical protein
MSSPLLPLAAVVLANIAIQVRLIRAAIFSNFHELSPISAGYEECWPDTRDAVFEIRIRKI